VTTPGGPDGGRRQRESAHAGPPGESHRSRAARTRAATRGGSGEVVGRRSRRSESSWPVVMVSTMAAWGGVGDEGFGEVGGMVRGRERLNRRESTADVAAVKANNFLISV